MRREVEVGREVREEVPSALLAEKLAAVVLLAGSVRATEIQAATGRAIHDLPIEAGLSILRVWCSDIRAAMRLVGAVDLPVRVLVDVSSPAPAEARDIDGLPVEVVHDPMDLRGTAGVLSDVARDFGDDEYLLVGNVTQVPQEPIGPYLVRMAETGADVNILADRDGSPTGILLIRCGALRAVPRVGFVDLKEQALPGIAETHDVRVLRGGSPTGMPLRTLTDYIHLLRRHHRRMAGLPAEDESFGEDWQPVFSVIEEGAEVDPTARVHDGVVLSDGRVGADALVVRSVVAPRGVLRPRGRALNEILAAKR